MTKEKKNTNFEEDQIELEILLDKMFDDYRTTIAIISTTPEKDYRKMIEFINRNLNITRSDALEYSSYLWQVSGCITD